MAFKVKDQSQTSLKCNTSTVHSSRHITIPAKLINFLSVALQSFIIIVILVYHHQLTRATWFTQANNYCHIW